MSVELALINIAKKAAEIGIDLINKKSDPEKKQKEDLFNLIKSKKDDDSETEKEKTYFVKKSEEIRKETSNTLKEAQDNLKELIRTYGIRDTSSYTYALGNKKRKPKPKKRSRK